MSWCSLGASFRTSPTTDAGPAGSNPVARTLELFGNVGLPHADNTTHLAFSFAVSGVLPPFHSVASSSRAPGPRGYSSTRLSMTIYASRQCVRALPFSLGTQPAHWEPVIEDVGFVRTGVG